MKMVEPEDQLKDWIRSNMKSEATSELDRWKEEVAQLLSIMPDGEIETKVTPEETKSRILLQFIGRAYAEAGGIVESASLSNSQVKASVGIPAGTVDRVLAELRSEHLLQSSGRGDQRIPANRIGEAVRRIKANLEHQDHDGRT